METAFLVQGLLAARQYFDRDNAAEREIRQTITDLWRGVEWDWYRKTPSSDFLYWHWSPDFGWHISHPLVGWNETMIVYLLAIASPTHPVPASLYHTGWAGQSDFAVRYRQNWSRTTQGDHYTNGNTYYGIKLDVGEGNGADLFFTQFSFMGFDPRGKQDPVHGLFPEQSQHRAHQPRLLRGESAQIRSATAPIAGGCRPASIPAAAARCRVTTTAPSAVPPRSARSPTRRRNPWLRSNISIATLGARCGAFTDFHDGFNETQNWFDPVWMGLNQAVIVVMIENYRSGVIWKNFMANPEIQPALEAIGFKPDGDLNAP